MIATAPSPQVPPAWLRLIVFWLVGLIAMVVYLLGGVFLFLPRGQVSLIAVPVIGCFLISLAMGLWTRRTPILLRAATAVSCVAIPLVVWIAVNIGIDL